MTVSAARVEYATEAALDLVEKGCTEAEALARVRVAFRLGADEVFKLRRLMDGRGKARFVREVSLIGL